MANYEKEDYHKALIDYSVAISQSPEDPFAHYGQGLVRKQLKHIDDAKSNFQIALIYAQSNNNTSLAEKINSELEEINLELEKNETELEENNS